MPTRLPMPTRTRTRWLAVVAAAGAATAMGADAASADEYYEDSALGSQFALVKTGQIDDPLEDVLEHASFLGGDNDTFD